MNIYEELEEFLELCRSIVKEGKDPFNLNVKEVLRILRELKVSLADFNMDSETLSAITSIIEAQEGWLEKRLSAMLIDPMLVEFRIKGMSKEELRSIALKCYHPIATIETLTKTRIREALDYWNAKERGTFGFGDDREYELEPLSFKELYGLSILSEEKFEERMDELKGELSNVKSIDYYMFVKGNDFQETFERSYALSFLITEGFVALNVDMVNERIDIVKNEDKDRKSSSVAIPIRGYHG